ncbi:hypothetical protein [Aquabacterium sp. CECT 9606]|uniref:hypothetical protein n=1 Tax=Aquabacterium sp. CECT 9606 TaxID=2845822 RepID=UPI001E44E87A|nr:hypothetical protein [Aquabacterium sp. CECT 9606]CAH0349434.1 hypothetical protein AQB9606_01070 [Aquabacterium sp. CECT 9606]
MRLTSNPMAAMGMFALMDGLGRALFKPSGPAPHQPDPGPFYWKVMYIDDNGMLQRSTMRVITLHTDLRRLTVWCDALGRECVLKISKIVEASDLQSGRKVNLHRWMASQKTQWT